MVLGTLPGIAVGVILTVVNELIFCLDAIAVAIAVDIPVIALRDIPK